MGVRRSWELPVTRALASPLVPSDPGDEVPDFALWETDVVRDKGHLHIQICGKLPVPSQQSQICLPHPFMSPGTPCRLFPIKLSRSFSHLFLLPCALLSQGHLLWEIIFVGLVLMIGFVMCERTSLASGRCTAPICLSVKKMHEE